MNTTHTHTHTIVIVFLSIICSVFVCLFSLSYSGVIGGSNQTDQTVQHSGVEFDIKYNQTLMESILTGYGFEVMNITEIVNLRRVISTTSDESVNSVLKTSIDHIQTNKAYHLLNSYLPDLLKTVNVQTLAHHMLFFEACNKLFYADVLFYDRIGEKMHVLLENKLQKFGFSPSPCQFPYSTITLLHIPENSTLCDPNTGLSRFNILKYYGIRFASKQRAGSYLNLPYSGISNDVLLINIWEAIWEDVNNGFTSSANLGAFVANKSYHSTHLIGLRFEYSSYKEIYTMWNLIFVMQRFQPHPEPFIAKLLSPHVLLSVSEVWLNQRVFDLSFATFFLINNGVKANTNKAKVPASVIAFSDALNQNLTNGIPMFTDLEFKMWNDRFTLN